MTKKKTKKKIEMINKVEKELMSRKILKRSMSSTLQSAPLILSL